MLRDATDARPALAGHQRAMATLDELLIPGSNGTAPGNRQPTRVRPGHVADLRDATCVATLPEVSGWARIVIEDASSPHGRWTSTRPPGCWPSTSTGSANSRGPDDALSELHDAAYAIRRAAATCPTRPSAPARHRPSRQTDHCGGPLRWIDGSTAVTSRCGKAVGPRPTCRTSCASSNRPAVSGDPATGIWP